MIEFIELYIKDCFKEYEKFNYFFKEFKEEYFIEDILPDHYLEKYNFKKKELVDISLSNDKEYNYYKIFNNHTTFFNLLQKAKIDGLMLLALKEIENNETILSTLNSFNPKNSYADIVSYNRTKTMTGRLVVNKGPKILTLPARCRSILKSRFKEGNVVSIDFKSLEPRIIAYLSGQPYVNDIYEEILSRLSFKADRSVIKKTTISLLYGSKVSNIENLSKDRTSEVLENIKEYFDFNVVTSKAKKIDSKGFRRNYFGRPIHNTKEKNERKVLNNYIQSSAVDLSLNYFFELTKIIDLQKAVPIFVIHDALILDVEKSYKSNLEKIINKKYTNKLGSFPLEITEINRRDN